MSKNEYLGDDVRYRHIKQLQKWGIPIGHESRQFLSQYERQQKQENRKPED